MPYSTRTSKHSKQKNQKCPAFLFRQHAYKHTSETANTPARLFFSRPTPLQRRNSYLPRLRQRAARVRAMYEYTTQTRTQAKASKHESPDCFVHPTTEPSTAPTGESSYRDQGKARRDGRYSTPTSALLRGDYYSNQNQMWCANIEGIHVFLGPSLFLIITLAPPE